MEISIMFAIVVPIVTIVVVTLLVKKCVYNKENELLDEEKSKINDESQKNVENTEVQKPKRTYKKSTKSKTSKK